MNERVYVIDGYKRTKYEIHEDGTVISLGRNGARGYTVKSRVLAQCENSSGYLRVNMNIEGKSKGYFVHRLVAMCFVENPDGLNVVNHKDGNKLNNHYTNLEWVSSSRNNKHAFENGLKKPTVNKGEKHGCHKLSKADVDSIRAMHVPYDKDNGSTPLARRFGVNPQTITDVVHFRTWKED